MAQGWMTKGSVPSRILDILEIEDMWMSAHALAADLSLRFDDVKLTSVQRAIARLKDKDRVNYRFVEVFTGNSHDWQRKQLEVRLP